MAGGTDLMIEMDPLVTHNQCANSPIVLEHGLALAQACLEVGAPALRNRATVAGNVVTASPANDTISALRALEADITLTSAAGTRTVDLADFFVGVRETVLEPHELVTDISFPVRGLDSRSMFLKLGLRGAQAISVVHLAIRCDFDDRGVVSDIAIALGSVAPVIVRATDAEGLLIGGFLDESSIEAAGTLAQASVAPIDDLRAPASYRSGVVAPMVRRCLQAIAAREQRAAWPASVPTLGGPRVAADGVAAEFAPGDMISTTINGMAVHAPWTAVSLLDWIREATELTGTKEGCAEGECGTCTIHLDDTAVLSCLVPAGRAHKSRITTIEGLADDGVLHSLQQSFIDCAAVQCGYCIPGFLMAGAALQASPTQTTTRSSTVSPATSAAAPATTP